MLESGGVRGGISQRWLKVAARAQQQAANRWLQRIAPPQFCIATSCVFFFIFNCKTQQQRSPYGLLSGYDVHTEGIGP